MNDPAQTAVQDVDASFIRELVASIRGENCVLLLGPGVAVDPFGDAHIPLNSLLARKLAADPKVQRECPARMRSNLRYVAQWHWEIYRSHHKLELAAEDFFKPFKGQTTEFHRHLAALPFKLCISTTPDDFMFQALKETKGKQPVMAHYNYKLASGDITTDPEITRPLVYSLCGRCEDGNSLVLTENDLIEFVVSIVRGDPRLPEYLRGRLRDRTTTFLFVGFEFQNWYLRVLLHVLGIFGHENKAVALEDEGFFALPDRPQTQGFFAGDRMIEFHPLLWEGFAQQLHEAYLAETAVTSGSSPIGAVPGPDAPSVFLCHASDDRDAVHTLADRLRERGLAVWVDQQSLRGGQRWNQALVDVISRQVDYVVVVQSARMAERPEGYYRKEIKVALDRQSKFDETRYVFIVPVKLGNADTMIELEDLQTQGGDVGTEAGTDALARLILDDWAKPHRRDAHQSDEL